MDLLEGIPQSYVAFAGVRQLWQDVEWLASRLATAPDQRTAWHHFFLACGNFKRPGGTKIHPWSLSADDWTRTDEVPSTIVSLDGRALSAEDPASWRWLTEVRGVLVPTATTILSALWPGRHAIMDVRSKNAAIAWAILDGVSSPPVPPADSRDDVPTNWATYGWYREFLLSKATDDRKLLFVERCLYRLGAGVGRRPDRIWGEYAAALERQAHEVRGPP